MAETRRPPLVLVVDDEEPILELLRSYLERDGMVVLTASDGASALQLIREREPDVVVLDVMLPVLDGIEVLRQLRAFSDAYVIMVSARGEELDRLLGLSVGADDYLVKPVSPREVVARVRTLLRRPRPSREGSGTNRFGALAIDEARHEVSVDGTPVALTALEFRLLLAMARDPGVVFTRQRLLDRVWGVDFVGDAHLVDVHIANLRNKLGDDAERPRWIETLRGVGYRMRPPPGSR